MEIEDARRWVERYAGEIPDRPGPSLEEQLDRLKEIGADGALTRNGSAAWYALVGELRRLADYYERDLVRRLRSDGLTWAQVADAVQAQLGSRQAAHAKWKRLIDPGRRTTTGDMQRGGRPRKPPPLTSSE